MAPSMDSRPPPLHQVPRLGYGCVQRSDEMTADLTPNHGSDEFSETLAAIRDGPAAWWEDVHITRLLTSQANRLPPEVVERLLRSSWRSQELAPADVARALRLLAPSAAFLPLLSEVARSEPASGRAAAFDTIAAWRSTDLVSLLCSALEFDSTELGRAAAAAALARFKRTDVPCVVALIRTARDRMSGQLAQAFATSSLGVLGVLEARAVAGEHLSDPKTPRVLRAHSLAAAYLLGDPTGLLRLVELVDGSGIEETVLEHIDAHHPVAFSADYSQRLQRALDQGESIGAFQGRQLQGLRAIQPRSDRTN